MDKKIRIGIVGAGRAAAWFADAVKDVQKMEAVIVFQPREASVRKFAKEHEISAWTTSYEELLDAVDAVYVASPHETHYYYAKRALTWGRHVLCEKPMTYLVSRTEELYKLAEENGRVLQEAVRSAYCPGFLSMIEMAKSGEIGEIVDVEACYLRPASSDQREFTNTTCGGSLVELGTDVLLPIFKIYGADYTSVMFQSFLAANGVDGYTKTILQFEQGMALAKTSLSAKAKGELVITGTKGYICCEAPWWTADKFQVHFADSGDIREHQVPPEDRGGAHGLRAFAERVRAVEDGQDVKDLYAADADDDEKDGAHVTAGFTPAESISAAGIMERFLLRNREFRHEPEEDDLRRVRIWAHRGCSAMCPENTLEAFEKAARMKGLEGIEFDVQLTKDGEVVVFHDETLERVTDGEGNLADYTLPELKKFRVAPDSDKAAQIPTLAEVLELLEPYCKKNQIWLNIELKTSVIRYEGIEEKTHALVQEYGLESYVIYSSFLAESVRRMKELDPAVATAMLAPELSDCIRQGLEADADALHPSVGGLDCELPERWQGRPVRAWNSEEPFFGDGRVLRSCDLRKQCMFGVTDIFTNVPERYL